MKVYHITPAYLPFTEWGGIPSAICSIVDSQPNDIKRKTIVFTNDIVSPYSQEKMSFSRERNYTRIHGYKSIYFKTWSRVQCSISILKSSFVKLKKGHVLHIATMYAHATPFLLFFSWLLNKKVLVSPHGGILATHRGLGRRGKVKRIYHSFVNYFLKENVIFVVSSRQELDSIQKVFPNFESHCIPYSLPSVSEVSTPKKQKQTVKVLFLGRLTKIKNIESVIYSLCKLTSNFELSICGKGDDEYELYLKSLVNDFGLKDRVFFKGEVCGNIKRQEIESSDVLVLPSLTENFGMVVVEALSLGVPVVASIYTPWDDLELHGVGLSVEPNDTELASAIDRISKQNGEVISLHCKEYFNDNFSHLVVGKKYQDIYRKIYGQNKK